MKSLITLFILSIISIFLFEDSMIKHFSLENFLPLFIFISLPFLLSALLGWKKGFILSIIISALIAIWIITTHSLGDPFILIYTIFFASFSVIYLAVAAIIAAIKRHQVTTR